MGTRAVITFQDESGKHSVYQHWDGDPETIIANLERVANCWELPRYEADEFAAAYIATHKKSSGNIRLTKGPRSHGDLAYTYTVRHKPGTKYLCVKYKGVGSRNVQTTHVTTL